ncbi:MAG: alpha/beta fold hydrolase [Gammaproteobacteria bacterium]|jgi:haloalkane dehalogenase|nr:alpha/beta fold hydrolase [Gammaproteobacteria bacterium]MBT5155594.1 alpha/beta fold hydrolase [Gammaproteobacteria bacterium]MBT5684635.1 alpha/beta fold hydrolase [Gammaproteobacteria bacterium]MBT5725808.1 alpha/beta fold hydrolase [Gammaproteobacteria bacterium]MBT6586649.1 alpha/beta fold hydrolase [Gammaproteobacteria bacterium]
MSSQIRHTTDGRQFVRTPDEQFENLPDFPYQPNYVEIDGLRMHYIDEGPKDGEVVLLLHGQPDWSYLYRKMIPIVIAAGYRVVAPDMIGMGRSDKPTDIHTHTIYAHADWWLKLIQALELKNITLFGQDWGGFTSLITVAHHPEYFKRVMVSNTALNLMPEPVLNIPLSINREDYPVDPDATMRTFDDFLAVCQDKGYIKEDMSDFFQGWMTYALTGPELRASDNIMRDFGGINLTEDEVRAYDAPFPEEIYMTGIRTLPSMASMIDVDASLAAWDALKQFNKPFLTVFGQYDMLVGSEKVQNTLIDNIPGAKAMPHDRIPAGHFIQESQGEEMATRLVDFVANH